VEVAVVYFPTNKDPGDPMEWNREALHVEFDGQTQKWLFKYYPKPKEPIEFEQQYTADNGIEKFDNFIKMIRW
jgi:hypothetical protein